MAHLGRPFPPGILHCQDPWWSTWLKQVWRTSGAANHKWPSAGLGACARLFSFCSQHQAALTWVAGSTWVLDKWRTLPVTLRKRTLHCSLLLPVASLIFSSGNLNFCFYIVTATAACYLFHFPQNSMRKAKELFLLTLYSQTHQGSVPEAFSWPSNDSGFCEVVLNLGKLQYFWASISRSSEFTVYSLHPCA